MSSLRRSAGAARVLAFALGIPTGVAIALVGSSAWRGSSEVASRATPNASAAAPARDHAADQAAALARHEREPIDAKWAADMTRALDDDAKTVAASAHAEIQGVDCRSRSCVIRIRWASYAEARRTYEKFLFHVFPLNGVRSLVIPPPARLQEPYLATLLIAKEETR